MKKQVRFGFTLVELLVVISIIGMLAGLLLPAIQAARESGRRAVCIANQSQVAMALLNYENINNQFPPMRGVASSAALETDRYYKTWVGYLLPLMEFNVAGELLNGGRGVDTSGNPRFANMPIPILKCKSDSKPADDNSMSYVVNGGYVNVAGGADWTTGSTCYAVTGANSTRFEPGRRDDAVFFDHLGADQLDTSSNPVLCRRSTSLDYISSHSGTSYTLLLSENTDAGYWAIWDATNLRTTVEGEERIAFCYPFNIYGGTDYKIDDIADALAVPSSVDSFAKMAWGVWATYDPIRPEKAYELQLGVTTIGGSPGNTDTAWSPLFINQGKSIGSGIAFASDLQKAHRLARPSSNHPNAVVVAFADRSVRILNEGMDKKVFIQLCQPNCEEIVDLKQLN